MSTTSTASSSRRERRGGRPTAAAAVRDRLHALGLVPSRRFGQSFLTDPFVADAEAALVGTPPGEPVVEIGGGLGVLTEALLRRGIGPLTVIERDARLARHLRREFAGRVTVVEGDAQTVDLPPTRAVVGNLPFSVATPILLRLFASDVPRVVALVQKEVAERLAASPGGRAYGRLTLVAALFGSVQRFQVVPSGSFEPPPEVEGQLVVFERRAGPLPVPSVPEFERTTAALFGSRRKQLGNLLPKVARHGPPVKELAAAAGWPDDWSTRRPEELPPEAFFRLAVALGTAAPTVRR